MIRSGSSALSQVPYETHTDLKSHKCTGANLLLQPVGVLCFSLSRPPRAGRRHVVVGNETMGTQVREGGSWSHFPKPRCCVGAGGVLALCLHRRVSYKLCFLRNAEELREYWFGLRSWATLGWSRGTLQWSFLKLVRGSARNEGPLCSHFSVLTVRLFCPALISTPSLGLGLLRLLGYELLGPTHPRWPQAVVRVSQVSRPSLTSDGLVILAQYYSFVLGFMF